ncbi:MAG: hypothetical protein MUP25_01975 [Syntrophales bacterium]|nr:hypothetical protein [Syntrophales bacterium]
MGRENRGVVDVDKIRESGSDERKFDAEVVWAGFDRGILLPGLTGSSEEEMGAFYEKYEEMKKGPDLFPRYSMAYF